MGKLILSVATCICNGPKYLYQQLEIIAAQLHLPDELLMCGGPSSDCTARIWQDLMAVSPAPRSHLQQTRQSGGANKICARPLNYVLVRPSVLFYFYCKAIRDDNDAMRASRDGKPKISDILAEIFEMVVPSSREFITFLAVKRA